ncbi:MAG TPA: hypothetical protein VIL71_23670 [Spirillospora sp.]
MSRMIFFAAIGAIQLLIVMALRSSPLPPQPVNLIALAVWNVMSGAAIVLWVMAQLRKPELLATPAGRRRICLGLVIGLIIAMGIGWVIYAW